MAMPWVASPRLVGQDFEGLPDESMGFENNHHALFTIRDHLATLP
jgi:hypothetical protein